MEKKFELVREFHDLEELEDYKASLESIERREKKSRVEILGNALELKDLNGKPIEMRRFGEYQPIQISENREYLLLQKYEEGKVLVQMRNFRGDRIWEEEVGSSYYGFISNDGNCSVFFKGYGWMMNRIVNEIEFYNGKGEKLKHVSFEGLIWALPIVFSNEAQKLVTWTKAIKVEEDGSREIFGPARIYSFDLQGNELWNYQIKEQGIHDLKIFNDGKITIAVGEGEGELVEGRFQGTAHIYFINDQAKLVAEIPFDYGCNEAGIDFCEETKKVAIFADQNLFLLEGETGVKLWNYVDPNMLFCYIDVSSQSNEVVAGGYDKNRDFNILLFDQEGKKIAEKMVELDDEPLSIEISDDGQYIFLELSHIGMVFSLKEKTTSTEEL
jgi:hypothetical protein